MKNLIFLSLIFMITSCTNPDKEALKKEILDTEKAFESMAAEEGIPEAFYYFADENAVLKRQNDTLITGRQNIKAFYEKQNTQAIQLNWSPDFIDVSDDGTMAYTYGKYTWKGKNDEGEPVQLHGVFHTVWKKQPDGSWKYVWD